MYYKSANEYFKETFGTKIYKASVSLDVTCPNRDGKCGEGGCIFCSAGGSGEFSSCGKDPVLKQIDDAIDLVSRKAGPDAGYLAYFSSFTSTYCDGEYLRESLTAAASHPKVRGIAIGTRPDCLGEDIMEVLSNMAKKIPLYVELGLQTSNDATAEWFNRGYETRVYDEAVSKLKAAGINVITHIIFGLKGEDEETMLESVRHAVRCGTDGVKFTCLYVLRGTALEEEWKEGRIELLSMEEYFDVVEKALGILPPGTVVHRLTGDGPKKVLLGPGWTFNKRNVVNYINRRFGQGRRP